MRRMMNSWLSTAVTLGLRSTQCRPRMAMRRAHCRYPRRGYFETLEERTVLTTTIFMDFGIEVGIGSNEVPNVLTDTPANFRDIDGPGENNQGTGPYKLLNNNPNTPLTFTPLDYDFDGNDTLDVADLEALSEEVLQVVNRIVEPFDIDVQIVGATSLGEMQAHLHANDAATDGNHDAYVVVMDANTIGDGLFGIAAVDDVDSELSNTQDEAAIADPKSVLNYIDQYFSYDLHSPEFNRKLVETLANTIVHEAFHTFSFAHSLKFGGSDPDIILKSGDVVFGGSLGDPALSNPSTVTRFPMVHDEKPLSLPGAISKFDIYLATAADTDIGLRDDDDDGIPNLAYVTGTGAYDYISLDRDATNPNLVHVNVAAYRDNSYGSSAFIEDYSYDINLLTHTEGEILIDSSLSDDLIEIDASIAASFRVRGMVGDDEVILRGNGASALKGFEFEGEAGDDKLTIDFDEGDPLPVIGGEFNFIGGEGGDETVVVEANGTPRAGYFVNSFTDATDNSVGNGRADTSSADDDQTSLRSAIQEANAASSTSTTYVFLPTGTYTLSLNGTGGDTQGDLDVSRNVQIVGTGVGLSTISAGGLTTADRVFDIASGVNATIQRLTITGGEVTGSNDGGGIFNAGNLKLYNVEVTDNLAGNNGGGIYNYQGTIAVVASTISLNTAGLGGGIASKSDVTNGVIIDDSAIIENTADSAGGVFVDDVSNISGPSAVFTNSTFSGNTAAVAYGGAIQKTSLFTLKVANCTITDNTAVNGGGIRNGSGTTLLHNTILAGNTADDSGTNDLGGTSLTPSGTYNLIGTDVSVSGGDGTGTIRLGSGQTAGLAALGDYGGPTKTHALLSTSMAIDHGNTSEADDANGSPLTFDQRGYNRLFDDPSKSGTAGFVDIGAFEYEVPKVANVVIGNTVTNRWGKKPVWDFQDVVGSKEQIRTVPVGNANVISVMFTDDVTIPSSLQTDPNAILIALNQVLTLPNVTFSYDSASRTAVWTFASALPGAQYLLRLSDSIVDSRGNALDGEWTNPGSITTTASTSEFPSGNDLAGGDFEFVFTILPGDSDRDMDVDVVDNGHLSSNYNTSDKLWADGDFSGDGMVDTVDLGNLSTYYDPNSNWQNLTILGDYDGDFDVDGGSGSDEAAFLILYGADDEDADLDCDGNFIHDQDDFDKFYEMLGLGLNLNVVT